MSTAADPLHRSKRRPERATQSAQERYGYAAHAWLSRAANRLRKTAAFKRVCIAGNRGARGRLFPEQRAAGRHTMQLRQREPAGERSSKKQSHWMQSSTWFVDNLRLPIPKRHVHLHQRTVWLSGVPQATAVSLTVADQVREMVEGAVGRVIAVTVRVDDTEGSNQRGHAMIFASLDDPDLVEKAEAANLTMADEDGGTVTLMLNKVSVDDELSTMRTLRLRGPEGAARDPTASVAVMGIPNGGLGIGDNRKIAELFMDAVDDSEDAPGATVTSVVVVNLPGVRNAQVVLDSTAAAQVAAKTGVAFWDPASNQDVLLKVRSLAGSSQKQQALSEVVASPRMTESIDVNAAPQLSLQEREDQSAGLWEEASTRQASLALEWWNRVQNLDEDEVAMRREEREAREAEEMAAKEEMEAQEAEAEAEAKEEAAWLAEERMCREEAEAEEACRRAHDEEVEAVEATKAAEREEEEANAAQAIAKELQEAARMEQEAAKKEADEAEAASKIAEKEAAEAQEAEAVALKEEAEAEAAIAAASTAESEARSLYMKVEVAWGTVAEAEQEVETAKAALVAAGKKKKLAANAQLFLDKVQLRCEKRTRVVQLKAAADKEVAEAEVARAIATKEREEAFAAKRDAGIEAGEADDARELAQAALTKANDAMRLASFERAEAVQAKRNAQQEVEEAAQAKRDALREMEEFEASKEKAKGERTRADEARKIALKERGEADEATLAAIKERSEANAARTKWATKQAAKQGMKWKRKAKVDMSGVSGGGGKGGGRGSGRRGSGRRAHKPAPPKFGKTRLWSASGRRPLTATVNFGNTEAYANIEAGRTHTKIVVGLDCALIPTGDAAEAARAALNAQKAKARVDRRSGGAGEGDTAAQVAELEALAGEHGGGAIKVVLTPRSLVSQIVHQDAWFHRNKKSGANGNWKATDSTIPRAGGFTPRAPDTALPELSPRYQKVLDARRSALMANGQEAMSLPINMRLPQLTGRGDPMESMRLPSDLW